MHLDKFLGCSYGLVAGDQLGSPVETMTACDIQSRFGEIAGFLAGSHRTDDSQTYLATMQALIDSNGRFDMDEIAKRHIEITNENAWVGWGRSTRKSCERLASGSHWSESGEPDGTGNGVLPRITALGLRQSFLREDILQFLENGIVFAKMTHLGTPAIVAAVVHAESIASLAGRADSKIHIYDHLRFLKQVAEATEAMLAKDCPAAEDRISDQIFRIMRLIRFENFEGSVREFEAEDLVEGFEGRVFESGDSLERKSMLLKANIEEINSWFGGGGSYAYHSFGFSYALFARYALLVQLGEHLHPFEPVLWAVNAGGDTDSNAAIIGALTGALYGTKAIPPHLLSRIQGKDEAAALTAQFFEVCKNLSMQKEFQHLREEYQQSPSG